MTIAYRNEEMVNMVNAETGTVDRRIFFEQDIYELELERIFARAWNFMAHDSQIPNPGDFFMAFIGEDRVICLRDNEGTPQVLVNSCRHRGNAICRADEGHATSFMCTYHGWTYDLTGALVGVPGFKEVYHEELDRENWGLIKAAQVETYKGFIFANMDPDAPTLAEYLGEVGNMCLDQLAERGDIRIVGGIQKYTIPCNWKFAVDNVWDFYHPAITHASSFMAGNWRKAAPGADPQEPARQGQTINSLERPHVVVLGEYGHALSGPKLDEQGLAMRRNFGGDNRWRERPEVKATLGPVGLKVSEHPQIFPNLWLATGGGQLSLRLPKGPGKTEIWWFTLIDKDTEAEMHEVQRHRAIHVFGPAGMLEQEDGENWGESTRANAGVVSRRFPLHYAAGLSHDEVIEDEGGPPYAETMVNEHAQLWHYRAWSEWMAAETWQDLKQVHSQVPRDRL